MPLYLCDMALERARLAFAQIRAFAPLNGMLEKDNPPKPAVPGAGEIVKLKSKAEKQLKIAADYIEKCGYHRRDEALAELQAVLRGERKFADLPPRLRNTSRCRVRFPDAVQRVSGAPLIRDRPKLKRV